ncbi:MAG: type 4b pilus protein PilO2 [Alphaproteobacteria bacterium]|nr:type 4b pilus protein PilO2 [Alphaproteobacteria bacterium]
MVAEQNIVDEKLARRSAGGSVTIGNTKYAVGLLWAPLQNQDDPIPEIREAMEAEPAADLYCQRASMAPQYGLGKTVFGHHSGEPSLAASVATALSGKSSACCVFKVEEGWWFVAIRNDLILAEEDVLFQSEDEAKRAFFAMMAVPDWDVRIVPAEWNVEGAEQQDLKALIENVRKTRLFELSAAKKTQVLVVLALLVVLVLGFLIYLAFRVISSAFEQKPVIPMPPPTVVRPVEPAPEKPKPWEKVPKADILINRCWNNAYQLEAITIPTWKMGRVTCTPQGLSTSWRITSARGARLAWVKSALERYKLNRLDVKLDASGTSASGKMSYTDIPLVLSAPTLTIDQIRQELTDIKQAAALPIQFSEKTVKDPPDNKDGSVPPNQQIYRYFSFSVSSPYSPQEWKVFFDKFSGLEFLKIEYEPAIGSKNKWTYEGRIYAK